jgi:hypothetical protein
MLQHTTRGRTVHQNGVRLSEERAVAGGTLRGTFELPSRQALTFRDDGTYSARSAATGRSQDGRYHIDRFVLELRPDGAPPIRHWLCSSAPETYLFVDGELWLATQ